jgi:hypothetical protein
MMKMIATTSSSTFRQSCCHFVDMVIPVRLLTRLAQVTVLNEA